MKPRDILSYPVVANANTTTMITAIWLQFGSLAQWCGRMGMICWRTTRIEYKQGLFVVRPWIDEC
jgi:hypothetical protein